MKSYLVKNIVNILLYVSMGFFIWYLYSLDYFVITELKINYFYLSLSMFFMFAGFFLTAISWWYILKQHNISPGLRKSIISHGLYVFTKYIPGKVWVILGRAGAVSKYTGVSLNELSVISLKEQFVYVIWGLILGLIPVIYIFGFGLYALFVLLTIVGLLLLFFSKPIHRLGIFILSKLFRKPIEIPYINLKTATKVSGFILLYWLSWSVGFYFLLYSVFEDVSILSAFSFPLGVSFGVLVLFLPGGIGVRESIITGYLVSLGVSLEMAITISVLQRLWFICGEVFVFLLSVVLRIKK